MKSYLAVVLPLADDFERPVDIVAAHELTLVGVAVNDERCANSVVACGNEQSPTLSLSGVNSPLQSGSIVHAVSPLRSAT